MSARSASLEQAEAAHETLFALTPDRRAQLEAFELLRHVPFDLFSVLSADAPDLTAAAFNSDLLIRNPWIRDVLGEL
ncbi:hypothetical protein [Tateyamaria sp. Alg231-49]|uniref:hypothetical protein n=1 Tax=Tateyamaria sp. Alg231-49 TaxID=1922219 RepID=UPI000D554592|nr:hypothetical protein [Tateyamaria sp. Alg231-49]